MPVRKIQVAYDRAGDRKQILSSFCVFLLRYHENVI